jgi:hypothetical protein
LMIRKRSIGKKGNYDTDKTDDTATTLLIGDDWHSIRLLTDIRSEICVRLIIITIMKFE